MTIFYMNSSSLVVILLHFLIQLHLYQQLQHVSSFTTGSTPAVKTIGWSPSRSTTSSSSSSGLSFSSSSKRRRRRRTRKEEDRPFSFCCSFLTARMHSSSSSGNSSSSSSSRNNRANHKSQNKNKTKNTNNNRNKNIPSNVNNHNNNNSSSNKKGYQYRSSGIKTKRIKPPQWEKEGDQLLFSLPALYHDNNDDDNNRDDEKQVVVADSLFSVTDFLWNNVFSEQEQENGVVVKEEEEKKNNNVGPTTLQTHPITTTTATATTTATVPSSPHSMFCWGDISVGPILAPRLSAIWGPCPTPIQSRAFSILNKWQTSFQAAILASPTGTGKTLAYLIPLLCSSSVSSVKSSSSSLVGKIWIVAPTVELLRQIQRVVDQLFVEDGKDGGGMYIVNNYLSQQQQQETKATSKDGLFYSSLQQDILDSQATIIGGTPKALLQIMSEWEKSHQLSLSSSQTSWLWNQVTTVVLEESDQLFKTELVARGYKMKKEDCPTMQWLDKLQRYSAWGYNGYKNSRSSSSSSSSRKKKKKEKQPMGLVCVSATVGRTLRRQIMEITGAPSMDKAAVLITADDRTKKDARRRQKSLLPDTIEHCYAVYEKGGEQQKGGEEVEGEDLVDAICQVIQTQSLARTLIFPGKLGVVKMVQALQRRNLNNVITLRDEVHWDQSARENVVRHEDDDGGGGGWESTPIYVVGEKFGRGLDIAHVSYVFLAAPPNSAAAYTHLAGRTGRGNHRGRAITMVQGMEEARRLASLSHTLGIPFVPLTFDESMNGHVPDASRDESQTALEHGVLDRGDEDGAKSMMNYEDMTVNQLKDVLRDKGLKVSGRKNELIDRLKDSIL